MDVALQSSDAKNLRQSFFELLQDFATFPAATNYFLVNIRNYPAAVTEDSINELGIRPYNNNIGLNKNKEVFKKFFDGYMFLSTGVNLTSETNRVGNRKAGGAPGFLPVGPFMDEKEYPDNDLDIQFQETNISIIDGLFRPWIQMYSVYGNMENPVLTTDVDVYFISKQQVSTRKSSFSSILLGNPGDDSPVVRKIYKYKDCIPYNIKTANVAEYNGDIDIGSVTVTWRFSRYDVITPYT